MKTLFFWLIVCIIGFSLPLLCSRIVNSDLGEQGHVHKTLARTKIFKNKNCHKNNTCDLKRFTLYEFSNILWTGGNNSPAFSKSIVAEYETSAVDNLKNYIIVQFIRGCTFDSSINSEGFVEKNIFWQKVMQFGELKPACHSEWHVDSIDKDPAYYSGPDPNRHYYYFWNTESKSFSERTRKLFGQQLPRTPKLYIDNSLFLADFMPISRTAQNVSYEFKICIFRTSDVPKETTQDNVDFATPIACHEWKSSFIYNFVLGKFESKNEIDPFCLQNPSKK